MKTIIFFLIFLSVLGCDMNDELVKNLEHPNGLSSTVNFDFTSARKTESGFVIDINVPDSRQLNQIQLNIVDLYGLNNPQKKTIDGIDYFYDIETVVEGSGGAEYELTIVKELDNNSLKLVHYVQTEEKPDFSETWDLITNSHYLNGAAKAN